MKRAPARHVLSVLVALGVLTALVLAATGPAASTAFSPNVTVLASGLNNPRGLTFGPDGVSGHKDHKAISRHTTTAVHAAGDFAAFPEQRQAGIFPYHPPRLFYVARLQGHRMHRVTLLRQAGLDVPLPDPELRPQGVPLEQLHVRLDVTPYLEQKLASMRSHRTQMTPDWMFDNVPWATAVAILGQEYLMQAHPAAPPGEPLATDFLDGLLGGERA